MYTYVWLPNAKSYKRLYSYKYVFAQIYEHLGAIAEIIAGYNNSNSKLEIQYLDIWITSLYNII